MPKREYCGPAHLAGSFPPCPIQKHREICLVAGCGKPTKGRQYCEKHASPAQRRTLTAALSALIRSECCDAKCVKGEAHDNGEQYCAKCKHACCWKTMR